MFPSTQRPAPALYRAHDDAAAPLDIIAHSAASTRRLGQRLGRRLHGGDVVLLSGDLGAGKTTVAQGIAAGLGVDGPVASLTFTSSTSIPAAVLMVGR